MFELLIAPEPRWSLARFLANPRKSLAKLLRGRPEPPAAVVCERCGLRVETACWHRLCPLGRRAS